MMMREEEQGRSEGVFAGALSFSAAHPCFPAILLVLLYVSLRVLCVCGPVSNGSAQ